MPYSDGSELDYGRGAEDAAAVTPNDSTDLTFTSRAIYVGGGGDLKVNLSDGTTVTFASIAAGIIHPIRVKRVFSTGTTATGILAIR